MTNTRQNTLVELSYTLVLPTAQMMLTTDQVYERYKGFTSAEHDNSNCCFNENIQILKEHLCWDHIAVRLPCTYVKARLCTIHLVVILCVCEGPGWVWSP
jgi:hypothetical protein